MNRPIKFRAFYRGKMYAYVEVVTYSDGSFGTGCIGETSDGMHFSPDDTDIVLLQGTGLIDANGKEIWEGDIVKMPGAHQAMWVEYQAPAFVMFHTTKSGGKSASWSTFDLHYTEHQFVEVIGNCCEHPYLLEVPA